ncbi:MAG: hypothetical protein A2051_10360 [Desulfovibrionales bacterium GWA2_65_9]|nr:MAG: hypothetical protein A2051_10360 [Desulfovibrionales bacterium GWA2_65_9]
MAHPRHIAFVISSLGLGGAERALVDLANRLAARGHELTVLTLEGSGQESFFPLRPEVRRLCLDLKRPSMGLVSGVLANLGRVRALRRTLRDVKPDAVLGFIDTTNVLTLLACLGLGVRVVVAERSVPGVHPVGRLWSALRRLTYPLAAAVVVQSRDALMRLSPLARRKAVVLPNAVARPDHTAPAPPPDLPPELPPSLPKNAQLVLALGRLSPEKNLDALVRAFAALAPKYPGLLLALVGEGPERARLAALAQELGLADRVLLPGAAKNPAPWLAQAQLFVLPSRYEGFPNALCEAMAHSRAVIATDCPGGVADIVRHGQNGWLLPVCCGDGLAPALAEAMNTLLADPALRTRLGLRASEVLERFHPEAILARWEELLVGKAPAARPGG